MPLKGVWIVFVGDEIPLRSSEQGNDSVSRVILEQGWRQGDPCLKYLNRREKIVVRTLGAMAEREKKGQVWGDLCKQKFINQSDPLCKTVS